MSKTLKTYLSNCPKGQVIKLGSASGSSFTYCGEVKRPEIYETISNISSYNRKKLLAQRDKAIYNLEHIDEIFEKRETKLRIRYKKNKTTLEVKLDKLSKEKERKLIYLPKKIERLEKQIKEWKPFLERKVVDEYDSISPDENGVRIIIIKGYEAGKYWTVKEYAKAHLPKVQREHFNERLPRLSENKEWL